MKQQSTKIPEILKAGQGILVGTALGFILSTVAFTIFPDIAKNTKNNLICSEWTGFCQSETSLESEETTVSQGKETLTKKNRATQFQSGKTLWDWLQLAAIPLLLVILGYQLQSRDRERSQKQAVLDKEIASANLRDEALGNYIERMSELLLDKNLKNSSDDALVRDIAITRTLTILRRLGNDSERKTIVIRFLEEAEIIPIIRKKFSGINLSKANLSGANLSGGDLSGANLSGGDLSGINLSGTDLFGANLSGANLSGANLSEADLSGANLSGANLIRANLNGADLFGADLFGANLIRANIGGANLIRANLNRANLNGANLRGADLFRANFREINLFGTHLFKTQNLNPQQIKMACYWQQAIYSEAQWELFQWVAKDEKANQKIIEALKQDNASDPKTPINCRRWQ